MTQAEKIINKFGGVAAMAKHVPVTRSQIYKWTWPKERGGTGGVIPTRALTLVMQGARDAGIEITAFDLYEHLMP